MWGKNLAQVIYCVARKPKYHESYDILGNIMTAALDGEIEELEVLQKDEAEWLVKLGFNVELKTKGNKYGVYLVNWDFSKDFG